MRVRGLAEASTTELSPPSGPSGKGLRRTWLRQLPLIAIVVGSAVGYYLTSVARFEAFYAGNWDLGINMQMLWSTTHGHLLYESGDFESGGATSFLLIHSAYVALPISYLYALFPGASTLFALQAAALSGSAIPLYRIGKRSGLGDALLWGGIATYLITFPILSGVLYDFHWESFIPAEFLWTYYLWTGRRYWASLVPAVLGILTIEVFPFLLLGLVLYGGYPWFASLVRRPRVAIGRLWVSWSQARPWVGLALLSVVGYIAIRLSQHDVVPLFVGSPTGTYGAQVTRALSLFVAFGANWRTLGRSLVYWVLLFAAFGFVPLLSSRRLLLINLPWFLAGVFAYPNFTQAFGNQYAFVAVPPLAIAFLEGLVLLSRPAPRETHSRAIRPLEWLGMVVLLLGLTVFASVALLQPDALGILVAEITTGLALGIYITLRVRRWWRTRRADVLGNRVDRKAPRARADVPPRLRRIVLPVALAVLVAANLLLSPFNPLNFQASNQPGYSYPSEANPAFGYMHELLSGLPSDAVVIASNNLFPFVANDVNAYSLSWYAAPLPYLPFGASHLPKYVLASSSQLGVVPMFLERTLFNQSYYGIRGMVFYTSYPGSIYLFERGYTGPTTIWRATTFSPVTEICPTALNRGPSGQIVAQAGTLCGTEIRSVPATSLLGSGATVWYGPYLTLLPGNYTVTISLRGAVYPGVSPSSPIVDLNGQAFGLTYWYSVAVNATELNPLNWTEFDFHFAITHPVSLAEFRGYVVSSSTAAPETANGQVELNFIRVVQQ